MSGGSTVQQLRHVHPTTPHSTPLPGTLTHAGKEEETLGEEGGEVLQAEGCGVEEGGGVARALQGGQGG